MLKNISMLFLSSTGNKNNLRGSFVLMALMVVLSVAGANSMAQTAGMSKNIKTVNGKKYYMHKVAHGQSLFGISKIYNVDINAIIAENPTAKKGIIVGQELKVPYTETRTEVAKQPEIPKAPEIQVVQNTPTPTQVDTPTTSVGGETDLLDMVGDGGKPEKEFVSATFKSTRNVNFHTTEILPKRSLDVRISHRFGSLDSKAYNAWGIDGPANLMISLEYSYDGRWMVGVQRSFYEKMGDAFFKWKILRQAKNGGSPVSLTYFGGAYNTFMKDPYLGMPNKFYDLNTDRLSFVNQLMVARKFNSWLSMQVGYAYVHYNLVGDANGLAKNDVGVVTGIMRLKFTKRQAIIFEYGYRLSTDYGAKDPATGNPTKYFDSMGIGWEIETGGHVFQLFVTNSYGILENQYLIKNSGDYSTSGMHIGFNIMRIFAVGGKKGSW